jgi:protein-S-isoprenylcysteine O-methyltransferase Ste14
MASAPGAIEHARMPSALPSTPPPSHTSYSHAESPRLEWLLRAFALIALGLGVWRFAGAWWLDPARLTVLLLLMAETYTLLLVLLARRAKVRDVHPAVIAATLYATFAFVLLEPNGTVRLLPEAIGIAMMVVGTLWQFGAKVVIGRSFGVLPAQRGVVTTGPYRVVRHPIYLGYLINHVSFLLVNFSWLNAAVIALLYVAQAVRILREEAVLASSSEAYRHYQQRVRWRLLPLVF